MDRATVDGHAYRSDEMASGGWYQSKPTGAEGKVFIGTPSRFVFALDHETGEEIWRFELGAAVSGAPAYANGTKLWEYPIEDGCMNASPALSGNRIYISMSARQAAIPVASRIRCLDADDGTEIWEHPGGGITGPAVAGGKVYFASTSNPFFCCVDAEGNGDGTTDCLWRCEMSERVYESVPAIYAGRAFILNEDGYLYAFE